MGLTPLIIEYARRKRLMDRPNIRSIHKDSMPRLGGVAIFFASLLTILPVLFIQNTIGHAFRQLGPKIWILLTGSSMMFLLGLYDDSRGLRPGTKLIWQLVAAVLVCVGGIHIRSITVRDLFTLDLGSWGAILTILWLVGITNAINLIDGLDGLAAGICAIACGVIAVLSILGDNTILAVLMLALLGSLTGFLFFNFNPAKIFMGDGGSMFLGFTIAAASVLTAAKSSAFVGIALPILVLGIPIFDTFFSMLRRFLHRRGIMSADRGHFHHRLLELGFNQSQAAVLAYLVTVIISGLGFFLLATRSTASIVVFLCCLILLLLLFRIVGSVRLRETLAGIRQRKIIADQQIDERRHFEEAQLHFSRAKDFEAWWQALCLAAAKLEFAHLALLLTNRDGTKRILHWQNLDIEEPNALIDMNVPIRDRRENSSLTLQVRAPKNGSLESVGRRVTFMARLVEEYGLDALSGRKENPT
jgi:UDP-GlcNAc:undecaprenyl-phosphate GlcNAc-1-phosphate transferase